MGAPRRGTLRLCQLPMPMVPSLHGRGLDSLKTPARPGRTRSSSVAPLHARRARPARPASQAFAFASRRGAEGRALFYPACQSRTPPSLLGAGETARESEPGDSEVDPPQVRGRAGSESPSVRTRRVGIREHRMAQTRSPRALPRGKTFAWKAQLQHAFRGATVGLRVYCMLEIGAPCSRQGKRRGIMQDCRSEVAGYRLFHTSLKDAVRTSRRLT